MGRLHSSLVAEVKLMCYAVELSQGTNIPQYCRPPLTYSISIARKSISQPTRLIFGGGSALSEDVPFMHVGKIERT